MTEIDLSLALLPVGFAMLLNSTLTVTTGLASSRGITTHPPLAVLNAEV